MAESERTEEAFGPHREEPSSCFSDTLEKKETAAFHFLCKTAPISATMPPEAGLSPCLRDIGGTALQEQAHGLGHSGGKQPEF